MPGIIELVSCQVDKGDVVTGAQIVSSLLWQHLFAHQPVAPSGVPDVTSI